MPAGKTPAGKTPAGKPDHLPARNGDAAGPAEEPGTSAKLLSYLLETSSRLQGPAIRRYVQRLRRKRPHATPADIVKRIQRTYLVTVIASGAAIGSAAILPGIGTLTALAAVSGETVLFLEATTVFVLAMAEVYGIEATDRDRRRALVLYVLSGEDGKHAVANVLGTSRIRGGWMSDGAAALPLPVLGQLNSRMLRHFAKKWALKRSALTVGKVLPMGIGAVIGAVGNWLIGRKFVQNANEAFGPAPTVWPSTLLELPAAPSNPDPKPALSR
ncbi:hypothetical protein [Mycolicibacterium fallax]|uniref:hypothetical protein n=1 Tax=Mycolicibacterium fallax TaxID=1793 RepID=UPI00138D855C|nr:hypothetical protein [Mycolicibacterium fallax]BBZ00454.1 hypothetical protein MFAL_39200 [Mycolicibacterium fallax]